MVTPQKLVKVLADSSGQQEKNDSTVYTVRLTTRNGRGCCMRDLNARVNICLIGKHGQSVLQSINPVFAPEDTMHQMEEICSIVDDSAGAHCERLVTPGKYNMSQDELQDPNVLERRFQSGKVDEICFAAPELGPLSGMLVGPESGSWFLDEVDVTSSRTQHVDRFICGHKLGEGNPQQAVYLVPVPPGSVMYGSGSLQIPITQDQASAIAAIDMESYQDSKRLAITVTCIAVLSTFGVGCAIWGPMLAKFLLAGGTGGAFDQLMLIRSVDQVGIGKQARKAGQRGFLKSILDAIAKQPVLRLAASLAVAFVASQVPLPIGEETHFAEFQLQQVLFALIGYSVSRLGFITSGIVYKQTQQDIDKVLEDKQFSSQQFELQQKDGEKRK